MRVAPRAFVAFGSEVSAIGQVFAIANGREIYGRSPRKTSVHAQVSVSEIRSLRRVSSDRWPTFPAQAAINFRSPWFRLRRFRDGDFAVAKSRNLSIVTENWNRFSPRAGRGEKLLRLHFGVGNERCWIFQERAEQKRKKANGNMYRVYS